MHCSACHQRLGADYKNRRTVATLAGLPRLTLDIRRCHNRSCLRYRKPYRPEAEGGYACPSMSSASTSSRTNKDLEQFFGSPRYHERRCSGRKGASPSLVVRGQARRLAAAATRHREIRVAELAQVDRSRCEELRRQLEARRQRRGQRRRFRRNPQADLQVLEEQLLQSTLPP